MGIELTDRQKSILGAVIREYVATAEPVASGEIARTYRPSASPATVRGELAALDEAGLLSQPHTSAGRIPTDKGYRFFINHMVGEDSPSVRHDRTNAEDHEGRQLREIAELADPIEFMKQASRLMAQLTGNFVLMGFPEDAFLYKWGASGVMREPEFSDTALMHEFGTLMDTIEDEILYWFNTGEIDEPRTFIGRENPIRRARACAMIVSACETPFDKESIIALIGPKRMDYEHNLALVRQLRETLARTL